MIIVTTTLRDLQAQAGTALTGGGTRLPMRDVIALARHANQYLAIFDHGKALGLYHTNLLNARRGLWSAAIISEAVTGGGSYHTCRPVG
jgi:hypothetical protein